MRGFDFTPLYRSTVGFDNLFRLLDQMTGAGEDDSGYPPYNIERVCDDKYRITMAVAGFPRAHLNVELNEQVLSVKGERPPTESSEDFLHRGIASRSFIRRFQLADHIEIAGADLQDGLLHIDLKQNLPEQVKPRKIEIGTPDSQKIASDT